MGFKAWNIRDLSISLNAVPLDGGGYAEDEVLTLEWAEDQFTAYIGADGEVSRATTNNGLATVTLKYAQTADANDRLSAVHRADLALPNGAGAGVFSARDKYGRTVINSSRAWVMGYPGVSLGKTIQTRDWKIQLANALEISVIGGR